jgi:hypothetical protein
VINVSLRLSDNYIKIWPHALVPRLETDDGLFLLEEAADRHRLPARYRQSPVTPYRLDHGTPSKRAAHRHHLQGTAYQGYRRGRGSLRADVYFCRLSKDTQAIAAKTTPAALSASVRIVSRGMPNSSCATLPVIIAAIAAVAKAMMRKATLPPMPMSPDNSEMRSGSPPG